MYWRIVAHKRTRDSQVEISERWTLDDLLLTHDVYEALDKAEGEIRAEQERRAGQ